MFAFFTDVHIFDGIISETIIFSRRILRIIILLKSINRIKYEYIILGLADNHFWHKNCINTSNYFIYELIGMRSMLQEV
jgi:hypothetical protein